MSSGAGGELWELSAQELAAGYETGAFTPSDVLAAVLARLDAVNPILNAVVAIDRAGAADAAARSDERWRAGEPLSPLDGVPITVKDNLYAAGLPATWGSRLHADLIPAEDEPAVARLRAAGAVLFAKTNVPEFTLQGYTTNLLFGTTVNPHAVDRTPGGSTGGGAAAVAAGFGPIAIGTDGGGSIRRPAAHCGLYGFKPSIGQIARHGGFPQILSDFEVVGPVARCLADIETTFAVLRGYDPRDPRSQAALGELPPWREGPRIAFLPGIGSAPVDSDIDRAVRAAARRLAESGLLVEQVEAPFDAEALAAAWTTVAQAGLAWHLASHPGWQKRVNPAARSMAEAGAALSARDYVDALAVAAEARAGLGAFFSRFDVLLCPTTAALAWPADEAFPPRIDDRPVGPRGHAVFTGWINVAGLAAVSLPLAMTKDAGGIGLQLVAGAGRDTHLLDFVERHAAALLDLSIIRPARLGLSMPDRPARAAAPIGAPSNV